MATIIDTATPTWYLIVLSVMLAAFVLYVLVGTARYWWVKYFEGDLAAHNSRDSFLAPWYAVIAVSQWMYRISPVYRLKHRRRMLVQFRESFCGYEPSFMVQASLDRMLTELAEVTREAFRKQEEELRTLGRSSNVANENVKRAKDAFWDAYECAAYFSKRYVNQFTMRERKIEAYHRPNSDPAPRRHIHSGVN